MRISDDIRHSVVDDDHPRALRMDQHWKSYLITEYEKKQQSVEWGDHREARLAI